MGGLGELNLLNDGGNLLIGYGNILGKLLNDIHIYI